MGSWGSLAILDEGGRGREAMPGTELAGNNYSLKVEQGTVHDNSDGLIPSIRNIYGRPFHHDCPRTHGRPAGSLTSVHLRRIIIHNLQESEQACKSLFTPTLLILRLCSGRLGFTTKNPRHGTLRPHRFLGRLKT